MEIRKINMLVMAVIVFLALAFTTKNVDKRVVIEKSKVVWKGYKVTGSHVGTIDLKEGYLSFDQDKLVGGKFIIDMTTITNTDQEGEYKQKLEGHLKSDDFFGVNTYPTATLEFKNVKSIGKNSYKVLGDLTVKNITKPVNFEVSIYGRKATASLKIDRAAYNVKFGSTSFFDNLKDKAIYDEFDLVVDVEF